MTTTQRGVGHRVDVGIPTFGEPKFLAEAIESVLGQTLTDWRLTISENGPGSPAIAAVVAPFLSDPRLRYVATGSNLGAAKNWSGLVQTGWAPYLGLLNDDDEWEPGFLARRVAFLEQHPGCAVVFSPCDHIDETGAVVNHFDVDLPEGVQPRVPFLQALYFHNSISIPTIVVRRKAYEAVGAEFRPDILLFDYEMWLRIASRFDIGFLPGADARYRLHASQITQRHRYQMADHRLALLDAAESFLPPHVSPLMRRQARYIALLRSGLDAHAAGDRRRSFEAFRHAIRVYPLGLLDPKVARRALRRRRSGGTTRRRRSTQGARGAGRRPAAAPPRAARAPRSRAGPVDALGRFLFRLCPLPDVYVVDVHLGRNRERAAHRGGDGACQTPVALPPIHSPSGRRLMRASTSHNSNHASPVHAIGTRAPYATRI